MADATFFGAEEEEDTSASLSEPVFFDSSEEEDVASPGEQAPASRPQGESPIPLTSEAEAKARGEMGITETAQRDYEAATGADAPKNPILAQIANMGLTVGGKLNANLQMQAAQRLASGGNYDDAQVDDLMDQMVYGVVKKVNDAVRAVLTVGMPGMLAASRPQNAGRVPNEIMRDWDATEGRRIADPEERRHARMQYAAQIAADFLKERTAVRQNAETELENRDVTHTANIVSRGLGMVGYSLPYFLGPVGIGLQLLEEGSANAVGYANDRHGFDDNGKFRLVAQGDDAGRAALAGFGTAGIETATEVVGGKIGGAVAKRLAKETVGRFPVAKVVGSKAAATPVGKVALAFGRGLASAFKWTSKKFHLENPVEENIEELESAWMNAITGWDRRASELVDPETGERTNPFGRFIDANVDFFKPSNVVELNEAMLITMGGGAFVGMMARRRAVKQVDNIIREHNLMTEKELKEASLEAKSEALDAWAQGLGEKETVAKIEKATGWVDRLADKIKGESGKFAGEVNALREKMAERDAYNTGAELDRLDIPHQKFNIPMRQDERGRNVPDFRQVVMANLETGESATRNAVYDESGIAIVDNEEGGDAAYTVVSADGRSSRDFPTLTQAVKFATAEKNRTALELARDQMKRQVIANEVEANYGGANVIDVRTPEEAVEAGKRLTGEDVSADPNFHPGRKGWRLKDGTILLVRDNLSSPNEVARLLRHEAVGHAEGMMQDRWFESDEESQIGRLRERNLEKTLKDGPVRERDVRRALRETVANVVQRRRHAPDMVDRGVGAIRAAMRKLGFDLKMNDTDLEVAVGRIEKSLRAGDGGVHESKDALSGINMEYREVTPADEAAEAGKGQENADETGSQPNEAPAQPEPDAKRPAGEEAPGEGTGGEAQGAEPGVESSPERKPVAERTVVEKMTDEAPVEEVDVAGVVNDDARIPNFKEGANPETGEVEPLKGEPYDLVSNPIVVMEFKDGKKVVVTGRHRLALYKRAGRRKIAARVIREADGWTVDDAKMIDSIGNIIDEKGSVKDYVRYFDDARPSRDAADAGGFLARPKGRLAFGIYEGATADTRAAVDWEGSGSDGMISAEQAGVIAEAAPKGAHPRNAALQRILVARALKGLRGRKLEIFARMMAEEVRRKGAGASADGGTQLDLFSSPEDQALLAAEERRADYRARRGREYRRVAETLRTAMSKGGRLDLNKNYAKELGITDPKDRRQLAAARDKAVERADYWESAVRLDDADRAAMDAELGAAEKGLALESVTQEQLADEERRRRERKAIEERQARPLKGGKMEAGQSLLDLGGAEGEDLFNRTQRKDGQKPPVSKTETTEKKPSGKGASAVFTRKDGTTERLDGYAPADGVELSAGREVAVQHDTGGEVNARRKILGTVAGVRPDGGVEVEYRDGWGNAERDVFRREEVVGVKPLVKKGEQPAQKPAENAPVGAPKKAEATARPKAAKPVERKESANASVPSSSIPIEDARRRVTVVTTDENGRPVRKSVTPEEAEAMGMVMSARAAGPANGKERPSAANPKKPRTPSVRMKNAEEEAKAQKLEDEFAALFDSPELDAPGIRPSVDIGDTLMERGRFDRLKNAIKAQTLPGNALILDKTAKPQEAARLFAENILGKTFNLAVGGDFTFNAGHFFRLVCSGKDGRKGFVDGFSSGERAFASILAGEVDSDRITGWEPGRARLIALIPDLLTKPSVVLEKENISQFVKRYDVGNERTLTAVFRAFADGRKILSFHPTDFRYGELKQYRVAYLDDAIETGTSPATAESNPERLPSTPRIVPKSGSSAQGGKVTPAAEDSVRARQTALSGGTSRNQNPSGNEYGKKWKIFKPGTRNVDIGAGRFNKATEFLADLGVTNLTFDPVNRSREENIAAAEAVRANPADTATVHNVLNVIDNDDVVDGIINQAARAIKKDGWAIFTIYEGNRSGIPTPTRDGFQRNAKTASYVPRISKYFGQVETHGNVITARRPKDVGTAFWAFDSSFADGIDFDSPEFDTDVFLKRVGAVTRLVETYRGSGVADFGTLATRMAERFPEKFAAMKPYLRSVWNAVADQKGLADVSRGEAERIFATIEKKEAEDGSVESPLKAAIGHLREVCDDKNATPEAVKEAEAGVEDARAPDRPFDQPKVRPNARAAAKVVGEFVSEDKERKALLTPFHDKKRGVVVASNGRILIATKYGFDPNAKAADEQKGLEKWWPEILPANKDLTIRKTVNPSALAKACDEAVRLARATGRKMNYFEDRPRVALRFGERVEELDAEYLGKVARAMAANGITEFRGSRDGKVAPIVARNGETTLVAMTLRIDGPYAGIQAGRRNNTHTIVISGESGRILSAPARTDVGPHASDARRIAAEDALEALVMRRADAEAYLGRKAKVQKTKSEAAVWKDASGRERTWPGFVSPSVLAPRVGLYVAVQTDDGAVKIGKVSKVEGDGIEIGPHDDEEAQTFQARAVIGVRDPAAPVKRARPVASVGEVDFDSPELDSARREYDEVVARYTNADGTRRAGWMKAPNGKPTNLTERQWVQARTPAFKRWFGDWENDPANASKAVDANGEPLVVYRGASFDPIAQNPGEGVIMEGAYFTANPEYARRYGNVRAYYLNIRRPFDIRNRVCLKDLKKVYPDHEFATGPSGALDWGEATAVDEEFLTDNFGEKYDGLVYDEGGDGESAYGGMRHRGISYVPAEGGAQVKSATDNAGAFDAANPDIRFDSPELDSLSEEEKKSLRDAQTEAQRVLGRIGGTELGNSINRDFRGEARTTLVGKDIRTAKDLAALAQVYRNPCFETFRYVFTNNGEVVWQTGVTSRLPGSSSATVHTPRENTYAEIERMIAKLKPDGVWLLHNHPSGSVIPSQADVNVTNELREYFDRLGVALSGHVVIDHDKYAEMDKYGTYNVRRMSADNLEASYHGDPFENPARDIAAFHGQLKEPGEKFGPDNIAVFYARLQRMETERGKVLTLIAVDSKASVVTSVANVPTEVFEGDGEKVADTLADYRAATGGRFLFVIGDQSIDDYGKVVQDAVRRQMENGNITDVLWHDASWKWDSVRQYDPFVVDGKAVNRLEERRSATVDDGQMRFSAGRVNPRLREEVEAALNTDRKTGTVLSGHAEVVFAEMTPQVLQDAGIQDGRIYTHAFILRKIRKDHGIDAGGMLRLADAMSRPVAILRDVTNKDEAAYIILTEQSAKDLNGRIAPVMVYLREDKRGNYLASAYSKTENGERQFVNLVNAGSILALNKNKVTDLNLTGEVKSSFESVKIGDKVIDLSRSTPRIVPHPGLSAQGGAGDLDFDSPELDPGKRAEEVNTYARRYYERHKALNALSNPKPDSVIDAAEGRWSRFRRAVQDKNLVIRELEERLGVTDKRRSVYYAKDREFGLNEHQLGELQRRHVEPIFDALVESGVSQEAFDLYLIARHAPYRNALVKGRSGKEDGSGMSDAEADRVIGDFRRLGMEGDLSRIADMVYAMNDEALQRLVDSGRLSQDDADGFRMSQADYVPLRTDMEDADRDVFNASMSGWRKNEFKAAAGRSSLADSPLAWSIVQAERAVKASNANVTRQVAAALVRHAEKIGKPIGEIIPAHRMQRRWALDVGGEVWTVDALQDRPDIIFFKEDGKLKAIRMEPGANNLGLTFAKAVTDKDLVKFSKWFEWIPKATRAMSAMRTQYVPTFILRNLKADTLETIINSWGERGLAGAASFARRLLANEWKIRRDVRDYFRDGTARGWMKEFAENGGLTGGGMAAEGFSEAARRIRKTLDATRGGAARKVAAAIPGVISLLNARAEFGTRVGIYATLREEGVSVADAVSYARDATVNFNRRGYLTPYVNSLFMFSNASIQGMGRAFKTMRSEHGRQVVAGMFVVGVVQALLDYFFGDDDDREERGLSNARNLSEHDKQGTLGVPLPGGTRLKWQVRNPWALPMYLGRKSVEVVVGRASPKDAAKAVASAVGGFVTEPVGGNGFDDISLTWQTFAPTLADPLVQWMTGRDFKGDVRLRRKFNDALPDAWNGRRNTPSAYKWVAKGLNALSGGNEFRAGAFDTSPENWQLLAETLLGGALADVNRAAAAVSDVWDAARGAKPEQVLRDVPFVRDTLTNMPDVSRRYYERLDAYNADRTEYRGARGVDEQAAFVARHPWVIDERAKALEKEVRELGKMEQGLERRGDEWTPVERTLAEQADFRRQRLAKMAEFVRILETRPTGEASAETRARLKSRDVDANYRRERRAFLDAVAEYDRVRDDPDVESRAKRDVLESMRTSNPLLRDAVRHELEGLMRGIGRRSASVQRRRGRGATDEELKDDLSGIEEEKAAVIDLIRKSR